MAVPRVVASDRWEAQQLSFVFENLWASPVRVPRWKPSSSPVATLPRAPATSSATATTSPPQLPRAVRTSDDPAGALEAPGARDSLASSGCSLTPMESLALQRDARRASLEPKRTFVVADDEHEDGPAPPRARSDATRTPGRTIAPLLSARESKQRDSSGELPRVEDPKTASTTPVSPASARKRVGWHLGEDGDSGTSRGAHGATGAAVAVRRPHTAGDADFATTTLPCLRSEEPRDAARPLTSGAPVPLRPAASPARPALRGPRRDGRRSAARAGESAAAGPMDRAEPERPPGSPESVLVATGLDAAWACAVTHVRPQLTADEVRLLTAIRGRSVLRAELGGQFRPAQTVLARTIVVLESVMKEVAAQESRTCEERGAVLLLALERLQAWREHQETLVRWLEQQADWALTQADAARTEAAHFRHEVEIRGLKLEERNATIDELQSRVRDLTARVLVGDRAQADLAKREEGERRTRERFAHADRLATQIQLVWRAFRARKELRRRRARTQALERRRAEQRRRHRAARTIQRFFRRFFSPYASAVLVLRRALWTLRSERELIHQLRATEAARVRMWKAAHVADMRTAKEALDKLREHCASLWLAIDRLEELVKSREGLVSASAPGSAAAVSGESTYPGSTASTLMLESLPWAELRATNSWDDRRATVDELERELARVQAEAKQRVDTERRNFVQLWAGLRSVLALVDTLRDPRATDLYASMSRTLEDTVTRGIDHVDPVGPARDALAELERLRTALRRTSLSAPGDDSRAAPSRATFTAALAQPPTVAPRVLQHIHGERLVSETRATSTASRLSTDARGQLPVRSVSHEEDRASPASPPASPRLRSPPPPPPPRPASSGDEVQSLLSRARSKSRGLSVWVPEPVGDVHGGGTDARAPASDLEGLAAQLGFDPRVIGSPSVDPHLRVTPRRKSSLEARGARHDGAKGEHDASSARPPQRPADPSPRLRRIVESAPESADLTVEPVDKRPDESTPTAEVRPVESEHSAAAADHPPEPATRGGGASRKGGRAPPPEVSQTELRRAFSAAKMAMPTVPTLKGSTPGAGTSTADLTQHIAAVAKQAALAHARARGTR